MKLGNASMPVELSGASNIGTFSINMNGKAFRVLSDTLYQNKIGSIVREISCNAYDAHVMAGKKDVPFTIHVPDSFEPWFAVKDQGVGLSDDEITNVFTVYFSSTKDQSNDAIGAFGLGAKTPFAYTDQFTVTSVKNGKKCIYSAFIAESGVPSITKMHEEDTAEPNGVEINIAVERNDFATFRNEISSQLAFFKVKPVIENASVQFMEFINQVTFENEHGKMGNGNTRLPSPIYLSQGNVGYPLVMSNVESKISSEAFAFLNAITRNSGWRLVLNFEIGDISVTASREGVEYTPETIKNIEAKIVAVSNEFKKTMATRLEKYTTDWDRVAYINGDKMFASFYGSTKIGNEIVGGHTRYYTPDLREAIEVEYTDEATNTVKTYKKDVPVFTLNNYSYYRKTFESSVSSVAPVAGEEVIFLIKDKTTYAKKKMTHFYDLYRHRNVTVYLFTVGENFTTEYSIEKATQHFGGKFKYVMLSSVELPETEKAKIIRARSKRSNFYEMRTDVEVSKSTRRWLRHVDISLSDFVEQSIANKNEVVYVIVDKSEIVTEAKDRGTMPLLRDLFKMKLLFDFTVVAVRQEDFDEDLDMKEANAFLAEKIEILKNDQILRQAYMVHQVYHSLPDWVQSVGKYSKHYEGANDPVFKRYVQLVNKMQQVSTKDYHRAYVAADFVSYNTVSTNTILERYTKRFEQKYPLLVNVVGNGSYLFGSKQETMHEHMAKYVKGVSL